MNNTPPSVRVDRWLCAARVFKTRTLATDACGGGKVDINDEVAKPARTVRPGDVVKVTLAADHRRVLKVVGLAERRGSPAAARALYEDLTPPAPPRARRPIPVYRPTGAGRPTKRERRDIERLRGW